MGSYRWAVTDRCRQGVTVTACSRIGGNVASVNGRASAPGALALVEALVNTLDLESGADALDTAEGRAAFGLAERHVADARELREALRAVCLAHAGHPPHRAVTPLGELLARAPLYVAVDERDGSAALAPADADPLLSR